MKHLFRFCLDKHPVRRAEGKQKFTTDFFEEFAYFERETRVEKRGRERSTSEE